jgi:hypothetical protein
LVRYFEGIQGDTAKRGELFGIENIFKLHENTLATKMAVRATCTLSKTPFRLDAHIIRLKKRTLPNSTGPLLTWTRAQVQKLARRKSLWRRIRRSEKKMSVALLAFRGRNSYYCSYQMQGTLKGLGALLFDDCKI